MRKLFFILCLLPMAMQAYDEELLFENEQVCVSRWKLMAGEYVGLHTDSYPQIVIALKGGQVTRVGADGSAQDILLPEGKAIFQEADTELHDAVNSSDTAIDAIVIELKQMISIGIISPPR